MTTHEVRKTYLNYMQTKAHALVQRSPLVLKDDATTLFTSSGMQPLLPYLLGEKHDLGQRLANSQICLRTQDIEEVGDLSHTTCFEMLGNWSLGDYFKKEQLQWFFDFLIDELGLNVQRIYVSCFRGSLKHDLPKDEQSAQIIQDLFLKRGIKAKIVDLKNARQAALTGMQGGRIFYYDDAENWWSRGGDVLGTPLGDPAGGDCEFFFDFGDAYHDEKTFGQPHPASDSGRFLEIGNSVFMEYKRTTAGFQPLAHKNVDFGGGLERLTAATINQIDIFKIDTFWPLILKLQEQTANNYEQTPVPFRVITDHLKAATWLALDGVIPSNKEQGYVMRRLLRRALLKADELQIKGSLSQLLVPLICDNYALAYPKFQANQELILTVLQKEETVFKQTLKSGLRAFVKLTNQGQLDGQALFKLYDTYGFPKELSLEQAQKHNIKITPRISEEFQTLMTAQRQRSQTAFGGQFKSGLADHQPITVRHHTATHLMYQALRLVLGDEVQQRGSNVTSQRLRFDFSYPQKVNRDQIQKIEDIVNRQIKAQLPISWQEMETQKALDLGALGAFGDKYGETVKVYRVGKLEQKPYSLEICSGPHVENTVELALDNKRFKILKEEACSMGVRRIKAALV